MDHINHYADCPELHRVDELIQNYYLKGDYETCFRGCLELAEGGYPLAECQVGYFYLMGQGTAVDLDKALYWTKQAAEHGDPDAPGNLAEIEELLRTNHLPATEGYHMDFHEKMHSGALYLPMDESILAEQFQCLEKLYDYNQTRPTEQEKRAALLREMFAEIGADCYIEPPLHANWGGHHVHFGRGVYCNFNVTFVDDTHIYVGDCTELGPNVVIATAGHPILPELREQGYQYNAPVRIGRNCWLGAGVAVVPGVSIGDNTVVGAGSVVTKDLPSNVIAVGNPCRVLREINEHDREYYFKGRRIDWEHLEED